jgi:hypothetical protein
MLVMGLSFNLFGEMAHDLGDEGELTVMRNVLLL